MTTDPRERQLELVEKPVQALAFAVHTLDAPEVARTVAWIKDHNLVDAALVLLAGLVDVERSPRQLLEWKDEQFLAQQREEVGRRRKLKPCGTPAAYVRHKSRGEEPCDLCVIAQRTESRERYRELLRTGQRKGRELKPCGTHAAFVRHKKRGEPVDDACAIAESEYQHARHLERSGQQETVRRPRLKLLTGYTLDPSGTSEPADRKDDPMHDRTAGAQP